MAFFPIFVELNGAPCLVAGGGSIALHKAGLLLEQGADVTVVSPSFCPELAALPVRRVCRAVRAEDAEGKALVVDATGSAEARAVLSEVCARSHTPYNCAGSGEACTAIFPAVHRQGRLVLAVSTTGASPAAVVRIRDALAKRLPEDIDGVLARMEELRALAKETFPEQSARSRFLHACLDEMLDGGGALPPGRVEALINEETTDDE